MRSVEEIDATSPTMQLFEPNIWPVLRFLIGLAVTIVLGLWVGPWLKHVRVPLPAPSTTTEEQWASVTSDPEDDKTGAILGFLERVLFFAAIWIGKWEIVAGWLAFKVASKWQVWSNVISVPKELPGTDPIAFLRARRRWGAQRYMSFVIGTLANILLALLGVAIGRI